MRRNAFELNQYSYLQTRWCKEVRGCLEQKLTLSFEARRTIWRGWSLRWLVIFVIGDWWYLWLVIFKVGDWWLVIFVIGDWCLPITNWWLLIADIGVCWYWWLEIAYWRLLIGDCLLVIDDWWLAIDDGLLMIGNSWLVILVISTDNNQNVGRVFHPGQWIMMHDEFFTQVDDEWWLLHPG